MLFTYYLHGDLYSDLWKSDLYSRPVVHVTAMTLNRHWNIYVVESKKRHTFTVILSFTPCGDHHQILHCDFANSFSAIKQLDCEFEISIACYTINQVILAF